MESEVSVAAERKQRLQSQLERLEKSLKRRSTWRRVFLICGLLSLGLIPLLYLLQEARLDYILAAVAYGAGSLILRFLWPVSLLETSIKEVGNELDLLEVSDELRAEKLFKQHQFELEKYYHQTLHHSSWIFWVGVGCIFIGFGIVLASLLFVRNSGLATDEKIVAAVLGAVAGILANFIALIYLKMHSETVKSLNEFHNRLVTTHHLHFGNLLVAKVDNADLREETLSQMAIDLAAIKAADESEGSRR